MWRVVGGIALALGLGFLAYRVALVAVPMAEYTRSPAAQTCTEGDIPRPLFDPLTGLPAGVVTTCADGAGQVGVVHGPIEVERLGAHWARAALIGLGVAILATIVRWWSGRRPRQALEAAAAG
jgi:hypothetical protein